MVQQEERFSNQDLYQMIIPLFLEQFLVMLVGFADTLVVSYAGEAAVSGVSLVNQLNTIFIYLFMALAAGGSVVISQYIGRKALAAAGEAASQLFLFSILFPSSCRGFLPFSFLSRSPKTLPRIHPLHTFLSIVAIFFQNEKIL